MPLIYPPAEDSFLMQEVLRKQLPKLFTKNPKLKFLEIGAGSGINLKTAKNYLPKKQIFACDINPRAVKHGKKLKFNCIKSDLFENIKERFDLIIFNSPYLPENPNEPKDSKLATTGGKTGSKIINQFLKQAKKHLSKQGKIFLLTSSLTKKINWQNYKKKKLAEKKLFFEKLFVWELNI